MTLSEKTRICLSGVGGVSVTDIVGGVSASLTIIEDCSRGLFLFFVLCRCRNLLMRSKILFNRTLPFIFYIVYV